MPTRAGCGRSPTSGKLTPVEVQIGLSDGILTEITGGDIQEGRRRRDRRSAAGATAATGDVNPFAPPRFGGRRGRNRPQ